MIEVISGAPHEHGHKSALAWIITGVIVLVTLSYRVYSGRRRRSRPGSAQRRADYRDD
jgi:hypothetical protein